MSTIRPLLLLAPLLFAGYGKPPTWAEVLEATTAYLTEVGGAPLRVDPDPVGSEFIVTRPDSEELERRRLRIQPLALEEISYEWVMDCYLSFTLPPPDEPPYINPECLEVPRDGSVVAFDDPVRDGEGWSVRASLTNRDVLVTVRFYLERMEGGWKLVRADRRIIYMC